MIPNDRRGRLRSRTYNAIFRSLSIVFIALVVIVVVAAGTLSLMVYGDARSALAHAKVVKLALDNTSQSAYAYGHTFTDPSHGGGVDGKVYDKVLTLTTTPGDFWLLQTHEGGYGVAQFEYYEGPYTVHFQDDPVTWSVRFNYQLVYAQPDGGIAGHNASE